MISQLVLLILATQFTFWLFPPPTSAAQTPPRPNILFSLANDLGYGDLGCHGQEKIRTPRLDRMASGGIRVPLIARWPGKIPPGRVSGHPSAFWDFLSTACEVAGVEAPTDIDGIGYLPELLGKTGRQEKHEYLHWIWSVRVGKWKLHPAGKNKYRLYDLESDIGETRDVSVDHRDVVERCARYVKIAKQPL